MSALNFLFNCIIFLVAFQEILSLYALPYGYEYMGGNKAYKLHTRAQTWDKARRICMKQGGHLAIINSDAEESVLKDLFQRAGPIIGTNSNQEAFIGIHDQFTEGHWTTVFGDSLSTTGFTKWSDKWGGQPDNKNDNQHCGALLREGGMDDTYCTEPLAFFCELYIPTDILD